jgi:hypothetical protein
MRELAIVLPTDVWLTKVTGTVLPDVTIADGSSLPSRSGVAGPALEVVGCAPGQESVAKFVTALENIDGVTRVGVQSSDKPESATSGAAAGATGTGDECRTRDFIAKFEMVVAFDAAPVPASAAEAGGTAPTAPAPTAATTPTTPDSGGVSQAQQQQATQQQSVQSAQDKSQKATQYVPGN